MTKIILKTILKTLLCILLAAILVVGSYLLYVIVSYSRIEDNLSLEAQNRAGKKEAAIGETYTVATQNIGFGAYTSDFTFFMDGGKQSRAESEESVISCVQAAAKELSSLSPDFILIQEVDTSSTRSYHVDERELLLNAFPSYSSVFAVNYHSAYLMYPLNEPHGASNSGILTLSKVDISSSVRRSLPISTSLSKFLDLDRCYTVSRIPTDNGKELILYNVHLSAYGGSDEIRAAQMTMLFDDMAEEYASGNYCVCGGDFNHDFTGDSTIVLNQATEATEYGWAQPFPAELLPKGISRAMDYACGYEQGTCRNCDVPYEEGNDVFIVDGFLVSENVEVGYLENVQTGYVYSDHNPVVMKFRLK